MNSKLILEEINKARDGYNSLFNMYVNIEDDESQRSYKKMLENQRKSLEELIKMYRKAKDNELEEAENAKWAEKDAALSASSKGDRHKGFMDEDE